MTATVNREPAAQPGSEPVARKNGARARPGWAVMFGVELMKLRYQRRVLIALCISALAPVLVSVALAVQNGVPSDTLFGRWVHESGYALPLVILGFAGQWLLPILISIVAGDAFASEDSHRTWTTMLTRSRSRDEVFVGKVLATLAYATVVVIFLAVSATVSGLVAAGDRPLVGLSGGSLSSGSALVAVAGSWASVLPPVLAFCGISLLFSVVTRNSWVGVVGPVVLALVLQLLSMLSALDPIRALLPTTGFEAWHGLVRDNTYTGPLVQSLLVSAGWAALTLLIAARLFARRDVIDA